MAGSFGDVALPSFDPSTVSVTEIKATWEVDERGHPKNIRLSPSTSGNSDVDNAIMDAIGKFRYLPARHNGVAEAVNISHVFAIGG